MDPKGCLRLIEKRVRSLIKLTFVAKARAHRVAQDSEPLRMDIPEGISFPERAVEEPASRRQESKGESPFVPALTPNDVVEALKDAVAVEPERFLGLLSGLVNCLRNRLLELYSIEKLEQIVTLETRDGFAFDDLSRNEILSSVIASSGLKPETAETALSAVEVFFADKSAGARSKTIEYAPLGRLTLLSRGANAPTIAGEELRRLQSLLEDPNVSEAIKADASRAMEASGREFAPVGREVIRFRITCDYFSKYATRRRS
jgi:hypothetical protein